jgi:hypothetical protein
MADYGRQSSFLMSPATGNQGDIAASRQERGFIRHFSLIPTWNREP